MAPNPITSSNGNGIHASSNPHAPRHQQVEHHKSIHHSQHTATEEKQQPQASHVKGLNRPPHPLYQRIHGTTLMIDNYDSFTYNVVQYLSELGADVTTVRNDALTLEEIIALKPTRLVISPGPGNPSEAGISKAAIRHFAGKIPVLGVCLGHQSMIEEFGGEIVQAPCIMHGKTSPTYHDGLGVYHNVPSPISVTRYHSLCGEPSLLPDCFVVTSHSVELAENLRGDWIGDKTKMHVIQGVRHKQYAMEGVQFHPESITTEHGYKLLANFLQWTGGEWTAEQRQEKGIAEYKPPQVQKTETQ